MAKQFASLEEEHIQFIQNQKIFFVATAMAEGRINLSPKGMDSFRVINPSRVAWLNLTGSGNESATHIQHHDRMTIMMCSFEGKPLILRLYGKARMIQHYEAGFEEALALFPGHPGARQVFYVDLDLVQTSCGYAVPFMSFEAERTQLNDWANKQGSERITRYWEEKNSYSLDGVASHILPKAE